MVVGAEHTVDPPAGGEAGHDTSAETPFSDFCVA